MEELLNKTIQSLKIGDSYELIKGIPSDSIDLIVTDPPYGLVSGEYKEGTHNGGFMGLDWDKSIPKIEIWQECLRVLKSGAFLFCMSSPRQDVLSQMIVRIGQAGFNTNFTSIYWTYATGMPKAMNISKSVDKRLGIKRKIISGESKPHEFSGKFDQRSSSERPKDNGAVSSEAKHLEGTYSGFNPKPAVEIIICAMKPLSTKSYTDQALLNRHGITYLDNCRIPVAEGDRHEYGIDGNEGNPILNCLGERDRVPYEQNNKGRFPANLLISDNILDDGRITTSSPVGFKNVGWKHSGNTKEEMTELTYQKVYNDSGSFSRYFDLDSWWSELIKSLPPEVQETFPFLIVSKPSKSEKNNGVEVYNDKSRHDKNAIGCNNPRNRSGKPKNNNHHPCTKPLKLFSYLTVLGSREGDTILDPFAGSGTIGVACKLLNRNCIMFELNSEYEAIVNGRCQGAENIAERADIKSIIEADKTIISPTKVKKSLFEF